MKKKINIICHYSSEYGGNFIPSVFKLANDISEYDIVFSFPAETKDRYWISFIKNKFLVYFFRTDSYLHMFNDIKKINKDNHVDAMYFHFMPILFCKLLYPFSKRKKLFFHIHSDFSGGSNKKSLLQKIKYYITYRLIRKDSVFICVADYLTDNSHSVNMHYIPNAYSELRIPCQKIKLDDFKQNFNIGNDAFVFLFFGWSPYVKGLDIVVDAFLSMEKKYQNKSKLLIVCKRNNGMEICSEYLNAKHIFGWENNSNIIFLKPVEDVISLFSLSNVFISASRSEGFSYSILESMICGNIVLMSDIQGTKWASKYSGVYTFETNNPKQLSALMQKSIINSSDLFFDNLSRKKEILEDYDIKKWSSKIRNILVKNIK